MINNNEQIIRNYIFQIRRPFSLVQVTEDTGVAKSSCQRVLKKYLKEGKIVRTGDGCTPKLYRYVYPKPSKVTRKPPIGSREAEVEAKAEELGVSSRTVYRREQKLKETVTKIETAISQLSIEKPRFTVYDIMHKCGVYASTINKYIPGLLSDGFIDIVAVENRIDVFKKVNNDS